MKWHVFRKQGLAAIVLAGPGVLCSVAMTGGLSQALYGSIEGFDWNAAFLLGSILSATDPVAVVAVLHTLGAPAKLSHLIEGGASLVNNLCALLSWCIQIEGCIIIKLFEVSSAPFARPFYRVAF